MLWPFITIYYLYYLCGPIFRDELKPFSTWIFDTKLLQRCLNGQTQNVKEAISSLLWSRCPNRVSCSNKTKLKACAIVPITEWNTGAARTKNVFKKISVNCGINTYIRHLKQNYVRILTTAQECSFSYRKHCQKLQQQRTEERPWYCILPIWGI